MAKKNNLERRKRYHQWMLEEARKEEERRELKKQGKCQMKVQMTDNDDTVMTTSPRKLKLGRRDTVSV